MTIKIDENGVSAITNIDGTNNTFKFIKNDQNNYNFQIVQSKPSEYSQLIITKDGKIYLVGNKQNTNGKVKTLELIASAETCGWAPPKNYRNSSASKAPEIHRELSKLSSLQLEQKNIYNKNTEKINLGKIIPEQLENLKKSLKIIENIKEKYFGKGDFDGTMAMFFYTINERIENTSPVINSLEFLDNTGKIILSIEIRDFRLFFTSETIIAILEINENNRILKLKNREFERFAIDTQTFDLYKIHKENIFILKKEGENIFKWTPENIPKLSENEWNEPVAPASKNFHSFHKNLKKENEPWSPFSGRQIVNNKVISRLGSASSPLIPISRKNPRESEYPLKLIDFIKQESRPNVNNNSKKKFAKVLVELLKKSKKNNNNTLQLVPINPDLLQSVKYLLSNLSKFSKKLNQPPLNITAQISSNLFLIPYGETSIVVAKKSNQLIPFPLLYRDGFYYCKLRNLTLKITYDGSNYVFELKNKDGSNVSIYPKLIGYNSESKKSELLRPINIQQESQNNNILEKSKEIIKKIKEKYFHTSNTNNNRLEFRNNEGIIILSIQIDENSILNITSGQISGKLIRSNNQNSVLYKFKNDQRLRFTINTQNFEIYKIDLDNHIYKLIQYQNSIFDWMLLKDNNQEKSKINVQTISKNNSQQHPLIHQPQIELTKILQKISSSKQTQSRSIIPSLQNQLRTMQSQIPSVNPKSSLQNTELIAKISKNILVIRQLNRYYVVFIYNGQHYQHELIINDNLLYCKKCSIQIQGEEKSFNFAYNLSTKEHKIVPIVQKRISNSRRNNINNFKTNQVNNELGKFLDLLKREEYILEAINRNNINIEFLQKFIIEFDESYKKLNENNKIKYEKEYTTFKSKIIEKIDIVIQRNQIKQLLSNDANLPRWNHQKSPTKTRLNKIINSLSSLKNSVLKIFRSPTSYSQLP